MDSPARKAAATSTLPSSTNSESRTSPNPSLCHWGSSDRPVHYTKSRVYSTASCTSWTESRFKPSSKQAKWTTNFSVYCATSAHTSQMNTSSLNAKSATTDTPNSHVLNCTSSPSSNTSHISTSSSVKTAKLNAKNALLDTKSSDSAL